MFKNRILQVSMAKKPIKDDVNDASENDNSEMISQISEAVKNIMILGGAIVAGYVILDTGRKVAVTLAEK